MPRRAKDPEQILVLLPMRVTSLQHARLERITKVTTLPLQDHIRRALDIYLKALESSSGLRPITSLQESNS